MIQFLEKEGLEWTCLNETRVIYDKPTANNILNEENLQVFLLKSRMKQACPLFPLLWNIVLEAWSREIRQEKEIKDISKIPLEKK